MHPNVLKADPLSPKSPLSCSIDMGTLRTMETEQLSALGDAVRTLGNVVSGLYCQPRFRSLSDDGTLFGPDDNSAGYALCAVSDWLCGYEQAIMNVLAARTPRNDKEVSERARALLAFEASLDDNLGEFYRIISGALNQLAAPAARQ